MAVPEVNDVRPVPPFVVANVPAKVIAPVVGELGVRPVEPAENDSTGEDAPLLANSRTVPESL